MSSLMFPRILPVLALSLTCGQLASPQDAAKAVGKVKHIIGHRGSSADRPENTLASYARAIEAGATIMEMDLRSTKDGVLISLHDADVKRTTNGKGLARELTYAELRKLDAGSWFDARFKDERIPCLREILQLGKGKIRVMLDLQTSGEDYTEDFVKRIAREVDRFGEPDKLVLGIRALEQAKLFRKHLPEALQIGLIPTPGSIDVFAEAKVDMIRLWPKWLADEKLVPRVRQHKRMLLLNGTTGDEAEVRTLLMYEPELLSSDAPARLIASLKKIAGK